jgi:aryl-alcohol dehydrogenase-like predicted oxidoreductase
MEYRHLGRSGLMVSAIAYGNWVTHGAQVGEEEARACIKRALDLGITTFDTADVYALGRAEEILGRALKGVRREGLEICTKVYWPTGPGPNDRGLSRKHILESCHASLRRLGTDYIDLYQAHRYDYETPLEETLEAFDSLVRQGKVLYVGVSEWKASQIEQACAICEERGYHKPVSNQPQYNIIWRVIEKEVTPTCSKHGIGQIVWSPLAQGVLTGKYRKGEAPPAGSRATHPEGAPFISRWLNDQVLERVDRFVEVARQAGATPAQLALAWVLSRPTISSAIVGATKPEQLEENVKALEVRLDSDLEKRIDEIFADVVVSDPSLTESPPRRP